MADNNPGTGILFSVGHVAQAFAVTTMTILRQIECGQLPALKVGKRWRVSEHAIRAYLALPDGKALPEPLEGIKKLRLCAGAHQ